MVVKVKYVDAYEKMKVLDRIKTKTKIPLSINIPTVAANDVRLFADCAKVNGTTVSNLLTLIFMNGYALYKRFLKKGMSSVMEMNYVISFVDKFLDSLTTASHYAPVLTQEAVIYAYCQCRNYGDDFDEFMEFLRKNYYEIVGDQPILHVCHANDIFLKYRMVKK